MSYLGKQPAFNPLSSSEITSALGFTPIQLSSLSATQNITYNSSTGQFTGPDLSGYLTSSTAASTYLPLAGGTMTGNLTLSGTGRRILGDFTSNVTQADRVMFQSSTVNGNTLFSILPNGTATTSRFIGFNTSDPANSGVIQLSVLSTDARLQSSNNGTGTLLPLTFYMSNTEVARVSTGNNFLIGTATDDATNKLQLVGAARVQAAATQDAVILAGRAGGTSSFAVTLTPTTLSASRTLTLPDNSGTLLTTGALVTVAQGGTGVGTLTGLVKGNGTSAFTAAAAGTDYLAPPSGTALLKANSGGALANAVAGTDYASPATAHTWALPQRGQVTAANTGSFDMNVENNFTCTPTGGVTLTFTNITAGQSGFITLVNGSNYTISKAAAVKVASGLLTTLSATGTYQLSYFSPDGTNIYLTASGALS